MNIILGGGITGLILNHYIDDSILYEKRFTVAYDFRDNSFPKYLHESNATRSLFNDLGITPTLKEFNIGILYNNKIIDFFDGNLTPTIKEVIYFNYCLKKYDTYKHKKMNGYLSGNHSRKYFSNKDQLLDILYDKGVSQGKIKCDSIVSHINTGSKYIIINGEQVKYDKLYTTLPLKIFQDLVDVKHEIKTRYISLNKIEAQLESDKIYDFLYIADPKYNFHRVTMNSDKIIFEFNKDHVDMEELECFKDRTKIDFSKKNLMKFNCEVTSKDLNSMYYDVFFIGRFSTGDYSKKVEDIIYNARSIRENI